jgi:hypothetical protein
MEMVQTPLYINGQRILLRNIRFERYIENTIELRSIKSKYANKHYHNYYKLRKEEERTQLNIPICGVK